MLIQITHTYKSTQPITGQHGVDSDPVMQGWAMWTLRPMGHNRYRAIKLTTSYPTYAQFN